MKVFLEGRLFGNAPITVYSVPKGDYIVEALYGNGKQVSKPVTVSENEETTVDLSGPKAANGDSGTGVFSGSEMTSGRKTLMWSFIVAGGVGVVLGATFGILELQAENDYKNTPSTQPARVEACSGKSGKSHMVRRVPRGLSVSELGMTQGRWLMTDG